MNKTLLAQLTVLFLVTQTIGLGTGWFLVQYFQEKPEERPGIISKNPEDVSNSIALIVWILFSTAIMLVAIKYFKGKLLGVLFRLLEATAVFFASWIVFSIAIGDPIALLLAILLIVCKNVFSQNLMLRNVSTILATAGAGAFVGIMLGVLPALVFMVLLAVYDYIAVFKTKHMVTLAKALTKKNLAFTFALPTKEHKFELGAGDMVIPLAFAVAVLGESAKTLQYPVVFLPSIVVLAASLAGLLLTIDYVSRRVGTALPALPLQTAFMVLAFAIIKIFGF